MLRVLVPSGFSLPLWTRELNAQGLGSLRVLSLSLCVSRIWILVHPGSYKYYWNGPSDLNKSRVSIASFREKTQIYWKIKGNHNSSSTRRRRTIQVMYLGDEHGANSDSSNEMGLEVIVHIIGTKPTHLRHQLLNKMEPVTAAPSGRRKHIWK